MQKNLPGNRRSWWLAAVAAATLTTFDAQAQLAGTKTIPGSYATLAAAIADLNTQGVGTGGVTFSLAAGYTETFASPTAGAITATGTSANPIVFQKSGTGANPLITAGVGTSTTVDAIISLAGSDYVTFDGIDVAESAANTTATTQMEFGYALFRPSATNGCQFNIIRNCVVTLNKTNTGTIGIAGAAGTATSGTAVAATATTGANSSNKLYGNVITNALTGIYFNAASATTTANYDQNNEIGVTAGNTIGNFGGSASGWGAGGNYQNGLKIAGNTLNSTLNYTSATASTAVAASTVTSTLRGIYTPNGTSANLDVTGNTITLASGATTSQLSGIENGMGGTAAGNTVNITGNTLSLSYLTATSAAVYGFYNSVSPATINISGNTLTSAALSTTGSTYLIYNNHSAATATVTNNQLGGVTRTGASGATYGYYNNGSGSGTQTLTGNTMTNYTLAGSGTFYGVYNTSSSAETQVWSANQVANITQSGSGTMYGLYTTLGTVRSQFFTNTISALSGGASVYGLYLGSTVLGAATYGNTISALSTTGTSSSLFGLYTSATAPVIYNNKIYGLSGTGTGLTVYGLYTTDGTTTTIYNNLIGDLQAPAATGLSAVNGLYINSGTTINAYYNTIYLAATSNGATFGTSGIYFSSTPTTVDLRNNIVVNKSTAAGTGGYTAALRRGTAGTAGTAPSSLASTTNNNLYYAGTPSAANVIYVEGTTSAANSQQTLAAYKGFVAPRESASQTEEVAFLSTAGANATFLHLNPAVPTLAEAKAQPISAVTTDVDGDARNANTPDIGADEGTFIVGGAALDVAAGGLVAPSLTGCYGAAESVVANIFNNGTQALNFATTPATVTVAVSGAATQTLTTTVSTGTLAPGASLSVPVGTLNMSAAGTYTFAITATVAGDGNTSNDNLNTTRTKVPLGATVQQLNFTGFTGANLTALYPGWYEALGATLPSGTTSTWTSDDYANVVNGPNGISAKINLFSNTRNDWMVSPRLPITAASVLSYDLAMTAYNATTAGTLGSDDRLEVRISTDCGQTFSTLRAYTAATPISNTGQTETISLASYAGQEVIIAFFATEGTVDDTNDNDVFIDNININQQATDLAATALLAPTTTQGCYGTAESVLVSVANSGTQALNFATTPATVTVAVSGAATQTLTTTVSTGTLAPGASLSVPVGTLNMSAAGTYTFAITATVVGDGNTANDLLTPSPTRTVVAPVAGTVTPAAATLCGSGTATLALTGAANGAIQWQQSTDNVTFADIAGATSATYTSGVLTSVTYFRARTVCNAAVATSNVATITLSNPQLAGTNSPLNVCAGSTATLTATPATGSSVRFFTVATGGTALTSTGTNSYTTPALTATTTYYAEAYTPISTVAGLASNSSANGTFVQSSLTDYPLGFATTQAGTLTSVDVYPSATGTLTLRLYRVSGSQPAGTATAVAGTDVTITVTTAQVGTRVTIPLNYTLTAGEYKLSNPTGTLGRFSSYSGTYPLTSGNGALIVRGSYAAYTSISYLSATYNSFFNLAFSSDCAGATRTPIQVNVTQPATASFPAATATSCGASPYQLAGTVTGAATTGTYTSSGTGTFSPNATTLNATYTPSAADVAAGSVTITLTSAAVAPCAATTATLALTVGATPVATFSYPATTYCAGSAGTVSPTLGTGATAGTFTSSTGLSINATTGVITLSSSTAGTYTVVNTVAASGNCPAATATATVTVSPAPVAVTGTAAAICSGGTAQLGATPVAGYSYSWSPATGLSSATIANPTATLTNTTTAPITQTYILTVTNASGCTGTAALTVTVNPVPARPTITPIYNGTQTTLTSSSATGNQFYFNGNIITGATGQSYVVNGSPATYGQYTVVVTNSFGCVSQPSVVQVVTTTKGSIAGASIRLYPNPTPDGQVRLEVSGLRSATQLEVLDALGRVVRSELLPATGGVVAHSLDLSQAASGVYLLRLRNEQGVETRRLVRE